ncbi:TonB-dependent receptor [Undibacterium sp. RTI2.1]|uniref:TonB-dependent receptor n=1 Tax=unclassified Undibacterium TaxID=2630295 RepID=UPI002AB49558|nr:MULTISPECIES: TonB-dependent receptor [unclassified Undibacterium]MDY7536890.1 TonB-dependent receptor [Undibacterium sp. 5I1]MEB0031680.1 TonB-dependent receptor [Undibacterium sp. RTI2.1]MEB0117951.1 TonB-dependent receptor [Undibacterium sp. RTI2.2]MEB0230395.1 TonB-dependent receptor [Undibacterium sp. 10I3]MEB0258813.1 TonB-dependent receptor [Undibacterium sp. 5I1]
MSKKSKTLRRLNRTRGMMLTLVALPFGCAMAQTAVPADPVKAPGQLEIVTVTAERRQENMKDVPSSISQLRGEKLDVLTSGGGDIRLLAAKVPSLNIESSNGRTFPRFYIRGYGNTDFSTFASQPVSLIYDDIVQENADLKGFPIFDLAGVEVLRGPQGTLFGRNTPAGVVKFDSAKPILNRTEGYYSVSEATYNTVNVEGAVNAPINKEWAMRFSMLGQHRDNFVDNTFTGQKKSLEGYNENAERLQFLYAPNTTFNALFNIHARDTDGSARLFRANIIKKGSNDLVDGFDPDKIATNGKNYQTLRTNGASARLTWNLDGIKLFSITGYEAIGSYFSRGDIDGGNPTGPGFIPFQSETGGGIRNHRQLTQEFRAESKNVGPLNWQAGLYYFNEGTTGFSNGYNSTTGAQTSAVNSRQENDAWAMFGSLNYDLTDQIKLRGGLRYTEDKKYFNANVVGSIGPSAVQESASKVSWDASAAYALNKDINLYTRIATGFRAPSIAAPSTTVPITVANAETILSAEVGIKADLFNRRARVNASIYDFDIKNQQLTAVGGQSNTTMLLNAAKTVGHGVEVDFEALLTDRLRATLGGSYNFTEIQDPNLAVAKCAACTITDPINSANRVLINGNPLPQAPKWIANATLRYGIPMSDDSELFFYTDWSYRSKINFFLYEAKEFTGKPLVEGGLRVGYSWKDGKYEVAAYSRNITNTVRVTGGIDFNNLTGFINEPRIFGVQFKGNF